MQNAHTMSHSGTFSSRRVMGRTSEAKVQMVMMMSDPSPTPRTSAGTGMVPPSTSEVKTARSSKEPRMATTTSCGGVSHDGTQRLPPLRPDHVKHDLETTKTFTGQGDLPVVIDLYRTYYQHVASTTTALEFQRLGWGVEEAELLSKALPDFVACRSLK